MSMTDQDMVTLLARPLDLPCGGQLKNRLIKAAMSDSLGDGEGNVTSAQMRLYERWADGGVALSLIGEVQVGPYYPEKPGNLVLTSDTEFAGLQALAKSGSGNGSQIWPQLGHAGALAHGPISNPKGPSPLNVEGLQCDGLTLADIHALPDAYARAAHLAKEAGFGGVQIHAGHGFLFSQFLSPLFNHRLDAYGGSIANRARIIIETIEAVRAAVGPSYPIGIKINSTDQLLGGLTHEDALEAIRLLDQSSLDLIDVSGGTYFPGAPSSSDGKSSKGPYFLDFGKRAKEITSIPVLLTGGFTKRDQAAAAIKDGAADAIGLARSMVLAADLPNIWLSDDSTDPVFPRFEHSPPGGITAWYSMRLTALAEGSEQDFAQSPAEALKIYEARDAERSIRWLAKFGEDKARS